MNTTSTYYCAQMLPRNLVHPDLTFTFISKKFIFPVQFAIGTTTNLINFIILNSKGLRTKSNNFLAVMAFVDFLFFLTLFPLSLGAYQWAPKSFGYVKFYYYASIPLMACSNWLSTASNWLIVAVTIERVLAVRFPLRAKFFCNRSRLTVSIVTIFLLSFALNSYHYVSRKTIIIPFKNNSVGNTNCTFAITPVDPILEPAKHEYVTVSICLTFATSIVLPMVLLIVLNSVLIHFLRKNRQEMIGKGAGDNHKFGPLARLTQEMKITLTVTILIVAFVVFNLPGGIVHAVELFKYQLAAAKAPLLFYEITELCNVLAITQKSLNFFLYCFSSATFRSRLYKVLIRQVPRQLLLDRSKRRANSRTSVTFITNSLGRRCSAHSGGSLSNVAENSTKSKLAALRLPLTKRRDSASDSIEPEHIRLYGGVDSQQVEHVYKNGYEEVDSV